MIWKRRKITPPPHRRDALLAARILRNTAVRESPLDAGGIRLSAPLKPAGLLAAWSHRRKRAFDLDPLGHWVWQRLDTAGTVEALIRLFAAEQRVNLREAEVAVTAFLQTLVKRGLIALLAPAPEPSSG